MVPYSNSTVRPSGRKVTRTMLGAGGWLRSMVCCEFSVVMVGISCSILFVSDLGGGEGMRCVGAIAQLVARGFHGLAVQCRGDSGVHHQLRKARGGFVEGLSGGAQRLQIVCLGEHAQLF